jgi:hypothetical protein
MIYHQALRTRGFGLQNCSECLYREMSTETDRVNMWTQCRGHARRLQTFELYHSYIKIVMLYKHKYTGPFVTPHRPRRLYRMHRHISRQLRCASRRKHKGAKSQIRKRPHHESLPLLHRHPPPPPPAGKKTRPEKRGRQAPPNSSPNHII